MKDDWAAQRAAKQKSDQETLVGCVTVILFLVMLPIMGIGIAFLWNALIGAPVIDWMMGMVLWLLVAGVFRLVRGSGK